MNAFSAASYALVPRLVRAHSRKVLMGLLLLISMMPVSQAAHAATTYTVTNTLDSGAGSLREAVNSVNGGSGGDTIDFSGVTGTITVGSTLAITQSVTINGPGANLLSISGHDAVRVFSVAASAANTVINGLTITHGNATVNGTSNGGGIAALGTLTVNNCTFSFNKAGLGATNTGAAIFSSATSLIVNIHHRISTFAFFCNRTQNGTRRSHLRTVSHDAHCWAVPKKACMF
jgi:hypothetical protein